MTRLTQQELFVARCIAAGVSYKTIMAARWTVTTRNGTVTHSTLSKQRVVQLAAAARRKLGVTGNAEIALRLQRLAEEPDYARELGLDVAQFVGWSIGGVARMRDDLSAQALELKHPIAARRLAEAAETRFHSEERHFPE